MNSTTVDLESMTAEQLGTALRAGAIGTAEAAAVGLLVAQVEAEFLREYVYLAGAHARIDWLAAAAQWQDDYAAGQLENKHARLLLVAASLAHHGVELSLSGIMDAMPRQDVLAVAAALSQAFPTRGEGDQPTPADAPYGDPDMPWPFGSG